MKQRRNRLVAIKETDYYRILKMSNQAKNISIASIVISIASMLIVLLDIIKYVNPA